MKNPFEKDRPSLAIPIIIGAAAAAAITYLFLTESGANTRDRIGDSLAKGWDGLKEKIPAEKITEIKDKVGEAVSAAFRPAGNDGAGDGPQQA